MDSARAEHRGTGGRESGEIESGAVTILIQTSLREREVIE